VARPHFILYLTKTNFQKIGELIILPEYNRGKKLGAEMITGFEDLKDKKGDELLLEIAKELRLLNANFNNLNEKVTGIFMRIKTKDEA
jgi:hypothetical protein